MSKMDSYREEMKHKFASKLFGSQYCCSCQDEKNKCDLEAERKCSLSKRYQ